MKQQKALILGATGGIGSEVTQQLLQAGWQINALKRGNVKPENDDITWFQGDVLNLADVEAAAEGCTVILHAVNPAGYKKWGELVLPMIDNTIAVAKKIGACIVLPGTVYNYGPNVFPILRETSEQFPKTRKGLIRVELEKRLQRFAEQGGQAIIVRAGDFFGPNAGNNWLSQGVIKPNTPVTSISNPSKNNVGHQWAYLPDVATTMVKLIQRRDELESFSTYHMNGFWDKDGTQMVQKISQVIEKNTGKVPKIAGFPWWIMPLIGLFNETIKELLEMKYLWQTPLRMDNSKLVQLLGEEPHTPIDQAIETTLRGLRCLT